MKKVLTIGGATQDIFIQLNYTDVIHFNTEQTSQRFIAIEEGKKIEVKVVEYYAGGGAVNSAASFARFGFSAESFFKLGNDGEGDFILDMLYAEGVCVDNVIRTAESKTGLSFILASESGNRSILVCRGANLLLTEKDLPFFLLSHIDSLYITSLSGHVSDLLPVIVMRAKQHKKYVACNPGTSQLTVQVQTLIDSLPHIDLLMLNAYEATLLMYSIVRIDRAMQMSTDQQFNENRNSSLGSPHEVNRQSSLGSSHEVKGQSNFGSQCDLSDQLGEQDASLLLPELLRAPIGLQSICFTLHHFFHEILKRGPRTVVVTNGAEGVYVTDGLHIYFHPSIKSTVVSTVGAGDAFNSTFTAYLMRTENIGLSIRAGVINAASVLSHIGGQTGLLSSQEIEQAISLLDPRLLQIFAL